MEIIAKFYGAISTIFEDDIMKYNCNNGDISDIIEMIVLSLIRVITRLFLLGSRAPGPTPVMTHYNTIIRVRTLLFR